MLQYFITFFADIEELICIKEHYWGQKVAWMLFEDVFPIGML